MHSAVGGQIAMKSKSLKYPVHLRIDEKEKIAKYKT